MAAACDCGAEPNELWPDRRPAHALAFVPESPAPDLRVLQCAGHFRFTGAASSSHWPHPVAGRRTGLELSAGARLWPTELPANFRHRRESRRVVGGAILGSRGRPSRRLEHFARRRSCGAATANLPTLVCCYFCRRQISAAINEPRLARFRTLCSQFAAGRCTAADMTAQCVELASASVRRRWLPIWPLNHQYQCRSAPVRVAHLLLAGRRVWASLRRHRPQLGAASDPPLPM